MHKVEVYSTHVQQLRKEAKYHPDKKRGEKNRLGKSLTRNSTDENVSEPNYITGHLLTRPGESSTSITGEVVATTSASSDGMPSCGLGYGLSRSKLISY